MRHPSFEGMRAKIKAKDAMKEKAISNKKVKSSPLTQHVTDKSRKTFLNPTDETQVRKVNGHELKFTHLSKVYWPKERYTKRDMLNYYYQVAPYILPYLKDRPQSLNRYPNGIDGKSFYHKDVTGSAPSWIKLKPYTTGEGEKKNFLVPEDEASILYMELGAIEMNPWNSTIHNVYWNTAVALLLFTQKATTGGQDRSAQFDITDIWVKADESWLIIERHSSRPEVPLTK